MFTFRDCRFVNLRTGSPHRTGDNRVARRGQAERLSAAERQTAAVLGGKLHGALDGGDQKQIDGNEKGRILAGRFVWHTLRTVSRNVRLSEACVEVNSRRTPICLVASLSGIPSIIIVVVVVGLRSVFVRLCVCECSVSPFRLFPGHIHVHVLIIMLSNSTDIFNGQRCLITWIWTLIGINAISLAEGRVLLFMCFISLYILPTYKTNDENKSKTICVCVCVRV